MECLLYIPINTFSVVKEGLPTTICMQTKSYLHETDPNAHFQSVGQYYAILFKKGQFNNQFSLQNLLANKTLLLLIENS